MDYLSNPISHFRKTIDQERIVKLDFTYLSTALEALWESTAQYASTHLAKFQVIDFLLKHAKTGDIQYADQLGAKGISAICITHIFTKDCPRLSFVVHEALSELFALNDIKYPYEEHKKLYLKPEGLDYQNWGNGYGEITPHSDDLYEDLDVDYLSLTVCRDLTNTPTRFYLPKDIFNHFTDTDIARLLEMRVKFLSGKNVLTRKCRERNVVEYSEKHGYKFCLDFRIDNEVGERMIANNPDDDELIQTMRQNILVCPAQESVSTTGTFLIVSNYKVLHARGQMNIDQQKARHFTRNSDYTASPRLLFRSKGQDSKLNYSL